MKRWDDDHSSSKFHTCSSDGTCGDICAKTLDRSHQSNVTKWSPNQRKFHGSTGYTGNSRLGGRPPIKILLLVLADDLPTEIFIGCELIGYATSKWPR